MNNDEMVTDAVGRIVWEWLSERDAPMTVARLADMFHAIASIEGGIGYTACHNAFQLSKVLNKAEETMDEYEGVRVMLRAAIRED